MTPESKDEHAATRGYVIGEDNLEYPEADPVLVHHFKMIGPHRSGDPLSFSEVESYDNKTMANLSPGQVEALVEASRAFTNAVTSYNGQAFPPPHGDSSDHHNRISAMMAAGFRQMTGG